MVDKHAVFNKARKSLFHLSIQVFQGSGERSAYSVEYNTDVLTGNDKDKPSAAT